MSHRPGGVNKETKHKLHKTPLFFTFASYNYKSTGNTVFTDVSISDTKRKLNFSQT